MNTLEYFLPTDLSITLAASDGGQLTNYVQGNRLRVVLSHVSWKESHMFTEWIIRPKWICLVFDSGNALPGVKYYTLTPGYWMPRECEVGWTRHFKANYVEHFDENCESMGVRRGPYRNTLLSHEVIDFGGDIGACDSITLEYHTGDERHTYARHPVLGALGMVRWSKPGYPTGTFNIIRHTPCKLTPVCGRGNGA